jgi:AcrR family transcriptional regulator
MEQADTKEQILRAAERLFASLGYQAASLRAITAEAGVNLAAVNYHFGSKEALFEEALEHRLAPINKLREKMLREIMEKAGARGERPSVREILRAFLEPVFQSGTEGGGGDFLALMGRSFSDTDETPHKVFIKLMRPTFELALLALSWALPQAGKEDLFWRLQFVIGSLGRAMYIYKRPRALYQAPPTDLKTLLDSLISFSAAGIENLMFLQNMTYPQKANHKKENHIRGKMK